MGASATRQALSQSTPSSSALERLFENPPKLHRPRDFNPADEPQAEDGLVQWGIQSSFLRRMVALVGSNALTLETGSGLSTICLAILGAEHFCVSPIEKEHNRIRQYCASEGISTERIRFLPMASEAALPSLDLKGRKLDFALIDGSHAFPDPVIDYHFVNHHLRVGGYLAIDDLDIPSVGILHRFLLTEPAYQVAEICEFKTGIYRKVAETSYPRGWVDQKFNSKYPDSSYLERQDRIRRRLGPAEYKLRELLRGVPGVAKAYHWLNREAKNR